MLNVQPLKQHCFGNKPFRLFNVVNIDAFSSTPKHLQLVQGFIKAIETGFIKENEVVPSLNELRDEFEISRDTAERCYKHLRHAGILDSVPGKGYFIRNTTSIPSVRVLLLFNKLSAHKKIIYDSFVEVLGNQATIDFHVYNNDLAFFKKLISCKKEVYSHYVIIPHFIESSNDINEIINTIPKHKLILLDKDIAGIHGDYAAIYEDFEKDIYHALKQATVQLGKYHTIKIIFPENSYFPIEIINGVSRFCRLHDFHFKKVNNITQEPINQGEVFISLMEDDLVTLIERLTAVKLDVGEQVGVISYNETPLKKLILNGITTISTDFKKMGALAAGMILEKKKERVQLPFELMLRPSL